MSLRAKQLLILTALISAGAAAMAQQGPGAHPNPAVGAAGPNKAGVGARLGDLSAFRAIAAETLTIVNTGDFAAAKKRIKDLELGWDQAESRLKPKASQQWDKVDVAIDRALKEVRAWSATKATSAEALQALISTMDSLK